MQCMAGNGLDFEHNISFPKVKVEFVYCTALQISINFAVHCAPRRAASQQMRFVLRTPCLLTPEYCWQLHLVQFKAVHCFHNKVGHYVTSIKQICGCLFSPLTRNAWNSRACIMTTNFGADKQYFWNKHIMMNYEQKKERDEVALETVTSSGYLQAL